MAEPTPLHNTAVRAGGIFTEEAGFHVPAHFGDPAAEYEQARAGAVVFERSQRGKVEVVGADAASFLHNLSTADVRGLAPGSGCEAFLTTARAKVVAHFYLFHWSTTEGAPAYQLDLAPGLAAAVVRHLDHFLISEQLEILDRSREYAQLYLAGPQAAALLAQTGAAAEPLENLRHRPAAFTGGIRGFLRRNDLLGLPGYDLLCRPDEAEALWGLLVSAGARPGGLQTYETLRVEAGTPAQGADIDENTFAPEVGRSAQAICYTKGCYLGQESIVMARDRGQVNRTLGGVILPGGPVAAGSLLYREGREVGRVTSSLVSPRRGTAIGLAYLRRGSQEPGTVLEVETAEGRRPAEVAALPFVR